MKEEGEHHHTLDVYHLEQNFRDHSFHNQAFDWNTLTSNHQEHRIPILQSTPSSTRSFSFAPKRQPSKHRIVLQERPIEDYFKASLVSCLTCFWMIAGIVCLIQSWKIRRLLQSNHPLLHEEARRRSNRLHTNLILTYVFGGMIYGVLIMTILVTFVVGIKGYFSRSL